ncbi:MAG: hypothetical protein JSW64_07655 [Candidatus Zixiibacteriota bacterium]|nr:MAG: hypothetical protein JSW64_07655 [candidate division Zixibacteria bacterium]
MLRSFVPVLYLVIVLTSISSGEVSESVQLIIDRAAEVRGEKPIIGLDPDLPPIKCGTPAMMALFELQRQGIPLPASALQVRADNLPFTYGGSHFLIHYDTSGDSACFEPDIDVNPADGHPDYINDLLDIFEYVWEYEVEFLNYVGPLTDNGRGGDDRLDVYLVNLGSGVFGFTIPDPDSFNQYQMPGYIEIDNDFAGTHYGGSLETVLQAARVTAAHEFFHTVQYAYDETEFDFIDVNIPATYKPWWLEASSTWMEDIVFDDVNDYLFYLPFFLPFPHMSLGTFSYVWGTVESYHPYGACVWPIYLSEKYGVDIIRRIWEGCATVQGYNLLNVTDSLMRFRSSSLEKAFLEFAVWNIKVGEYADPDSSYDEGESFPFPDTSVGIGTLPSIPLEFGGVGPQPEHLGVNYVVINTGYNEGGIGIDFDGEDLTGAGWHVAAAGHRQNYSPWQDLDVDPLSGSGLGEWRDWNLYWDVTLVITVAGLTPFYDSYNYNGTVWFDSSLRGEGAPPGFKLISAFPSPFVINDPLDEVTIRYSLDLRYDRGDIYIWVFDLSGNRVRKIEDVRTDFGAQNGAAWDGKNDNDEYVASGIYILLLEGAGKSSSMKIAVVKNIN